MRYPRNATLPHLTFAGPRDRDVLGSHTVVVSAEADGAAVCRYGLRLAARK